MVDSDYLLLPSYISRSGVMNRQLTLIIVTWALVTAKRDVSPEKSLLDTLLSNYSPIARPILNANQSVDVDVGFIFLGIIRLDESEQTMTSVGTIKMSWIDPYLTWNPKEFSDIESVYLPPDHVWRPGIVTLNSFSSDEDSIQQKSSLLQLFSNGTIVWMPTGLLHVSCSMDITWFPFDKQNCSVSIGASSYDSSFVSLNLKIEPRWAFRGAFPQILDNSQWEVLGEDSSTYQTSKAGRKMLLFTAHVKRRSRHFIFNIVIPSFILAALNIFVLLIPHELSDVIGVSTTLVLAYTIFLTQITTMTPTNSSQIPFITVILLVVMMFSAFDVIASILVLRCVSHDASRPPPAWLVRLTCRGRPTEGRHHRHSVGVSGEKSTSAEALEDSVSVKSQKLEYRQQWMSVIWVIERVVIAVQTLCVLGMYGSVPLLYLSFV